MRSYPAHEDIGLIEDDNTEDLRKKSDVARAATPTTSEPHHPIGKEVR